MSGLSGIRDAVVSCHEKCSDVSSLGKVVVIFCTVNHENLPPNANSSSQGLVEHVWIVEIVKSQEH